MKRKRFYILVATLLIITLILPGTAALAAGNKNQHQNDFTWECNVGHLYLYEKTGVPDWEIVEGGAWAKMNYSLSGSEFEYLFNGHRLDPNIDYSLIYYADDWPGNNPGALIAAGTTNRWGNLHLAGSVELNIDLPYPNDVNYPDGAKIWLVPSSDYNETTNSMTAWNPGEYLFENNFITYDDTDIP
ncbi:hypothetical protein ACFLWG_04030 [Chloroflexota bacterium]